MAYFNHAAASNCVFYIIGKLAMVHLLLLYDLITNAPLLFVIVVFFKDGTWVATACRAEVAGAVGLQGTTRAGTPWAKVSQHHRCGCAKHSLGHAHCLHLALLQGSAVPPKGRGPCGLVLLMQSGTGGPVGL